MRDVGDFITINCNTDGPMVLDTAAEKEDKLEVVMKYLRAAEKGALSTISQCLLRYQHISTLVANPYVRNFGELGHYP